MAIEEFKDLLLKVAQIHFPRAFITVQEKRSIILEARLNIEEQLFVYVYFNALTGRKSYSLIHKGRRAFGYDNRKFWHRHPAENPETHIRCKEPSMGTVLQEMREIVEKLP